MKTLAVWFFILCLALLPLLLCATAKGQTLVERIEAAIPTVASADEQSVDAHDLAVAIDQAAGGRREWSALLLTVAAHESRLITRIAIGNCKKLECDRGRAWGLFQVHKLAANAAVWGSPVLEVQALEANRLLVRAYNTCNRGARRADWAARTINAYAGRRCDDDWQGLRDRIATFEKLKTKL